MKKKITVIALSIMLAVFIMSGGYGLWSETITIEGIINVLPNPDEVEATKQQLLKQKLLMEKESEKAKLEETQETTDKETPKEDTSPSSKELNIPQPPIGESNGDQNNNNELQPVESNDIISGEQGYTNHQTENPINMENNKQEQTDNVIPPVKSAEESDIAK